MSGFCIQGAGEPRLSALLVAGLFHLCSFVLSHPLYFSYLVFFWPYLFRLLSFLYPLFLTTSLLLVALLTLSSPALVLRGSPSDPSESKAGFLRQTCSAVRERLRPRIEDGSEEFQGRGFEELDIYKIVFETSSFEAGEVPAHTSEPTSEENRSPILEAPAKEQYDEGVFSSESGDESGIGEENSVEKALLTLECIWQEEDAREHAPGKAGDKEEAEPAMSVESKKVEDRETPQRRSGSEVMMPSSQMKETTAKVEADNGGGFAAKVRRNSRRWSGSFGDFSNNAKYPSKAEDHQMLHPPRGSMRKEKEWKRTLACKLFEERHNADAGEGMDLLWETYETEASRPAGKARPKKGKMWKVRYGRGDEWGKKAEEEEEEEEEEDEEEGVDRQLCCLQALRISAGKLNLGMGKPNLVKITKALKGIGWLHQVNRRGKKSYG